MQTDLGGIEIELFDAVQAPDVSTPQNVANFLNYVNDGDYEGTFIQLSSRATDNLVPPVEVLQLGGYAFNPALGSFTDNTGIFHIPVDSTVVPQELGNSNLRGTLAMARLGGQPDSANSEFFINLADNIILDTSDGGFSVFGRVTRGMDVIDAIAALDRCRDVGFNLPIPCTGFPYVPLVGIETVDGNGGPFSTPVLNSNLINFDNIGIDSDGDGIIDKVEDAAPGSGDADGDLVDDRLQQDVASFESVNQSYVTLESSAPAVIEDTDVMGITFAYTTIDRFDPNHDLIDVVFLEGFFGATLTGLAMSGDTATLTVTLPTADIANSYMAYGPTPADTSPHWYTYTENAVPGVSFAGNVVTLSLVDGQIGDADMTANGVIVISPGGAIRFQGDSDGIPDFVEDGAPNNGDGNNDGDPDRDQDYVVSLPDQNGNYLTLETSSQYKLGGVSFIEGEAILAIPGPGGTFIPNPNIPTELVTGFNFAHDFLNFELSNLPMGGIPASVDVRIILPDGEKPTSYLKFGPTPTDPTNHVYDFSYDPVTGTGAKFSDNNVVTLHFVDGGRGDFDLTENGVIKDPGAVALPISTITDTDGGGGGCSLRGASGSPWQAGGWWLLLALLMWCRMLAVCCRRSALPDT
jgi:cyclophilin family peptidyl-prolyl cis-trans isomerase